MANLPYLSGIGEAQKYLNQLRQNGRGEEADGVVQPFAFLRFKAREKDGSPGDEKTDWREGEEEAARHLSTHRERLG